MKKLDGKKKERIHEIEKLEKIEKEKSNIKQLEESCKRARAKEKETEELANRMLVEANKLLTESVAKKDFTSITVASNMLENVKTIKLPEQKQREDVTNIGGKLEKIKSVIFDKFCIKKCKAIDNK